MGKYNNDLYNSSESYFTPLQLVLRRFFKNKLSLFGIIIILFMFLFSFIGPIFSPYGEYDIFFIDKFGKEHSLNENIDYNEKGLKVLSKSLPSKNHLLGTDKDGRDVFVRLMYGGRVSLLIGFIVIIIELIIGIILGGIAGYYGKLVDVIIMRLVDIFNCIPSIPIMLIISSIMISFKISNDIKIYVMVIVVGFLGWTGITRIVRGQILSIKEQEYMFATEVIGLSTKDKIFKHLVPNVMPQLLVFSTLGLGSVILFESALSYLGMGVSFPYASWGNMVNVVNDPIIMSHNINIWLPPGLCILFTVLGFNFIGDGLRDAFDPKIKSR